MKLPGYLTPVVMALMVVFGCAGTGQVGKLRNQSKTDSGATWQMLVENWSEYHIWFKSAVIVFDPKSDDNTLLVAGHWGTVNDQKTWSEIVRQNTTGKGAIDPRFASYAMTPVREIWSPDNQLYGYIIHQVRDGVSVRVVDDSTMRIFYHRARFGGP
jgi:hypothetical protein